MRSLLLFVAAAWAAVYNVYPPNNWNAYKSSLQPGDVLTIHPETPGQPYSYQIDGSNKFFMYGTASNPIIVQGAPGEKVTMLMNACQNAVELTGTYFVFRNFFITVTSSATGAIGLRLMANVSHSIIDNCTVHDVYETAMSANVYYAYYENVTFSNNEIYHTGGTGECIYVGCQGDPTTIHCQFVNGALINNYCHDTCAITPCAGGSEGSGLQVKGWGSYGNVVRGNVCKNVNMVSILMYDDWDMGANIVENNFVFGSVNDAGIQASAGIIIRNNVLVGNQRGIAITNNPANLKAGLFNRNVHISGNTIVNNVVGGIRLPTFDPAASSRVSNNVVIEDGGASAFAGDDQPGVSWFNNAYYGGSALGGVSGTGAFTVGTSDTLFQDVPGRNFHPKAGVALLGAGAPLVAKDLPTDFDCQARSANTPTVGAYELTTGSAIALGFRGSCSTAPTAPTSPPPTMAPTAACSTVNCGAHGTCIDPNPVCVCNDSYTGLRCETPPVDRCVGNPPQVDCGSHGTCSNGTCTCLGNYTGTLCTVPPAPTCTDGVKNSDEAGIDCGGTTAGCPACPSYSWSPNNFTACSLTCGSGTQTRTVDCIDTATNAVVNAALCNAAPHNFTTSQGCNFDPCATYTWKTGVWENCSVACNTGSQTRTVECMSSIGNVTVADSFCAAATKPTSSQTCNTVACQANYWLSGNWSNCSFACGTGTQVRTVQCLTPQNAVVADSMCPAPAPITSQQCNTDACVSYVWKACQTFYPCTAQCNGGGAMVGQQYRDVFCIRDIDNKAVDIVLCDNATKPTSMLSVCNTQPCTGFNWMANDNFGPCTLQPEGVYQRFRKFHCHAASGALATLADCEANAGKTPIAALPCTPGTCASTTGCPVVDIAELFNQCFLLSMLQSCDVSSPCARAAYALEAQIKTLALAVDAPAQCVNVYVASLSANEAPKADLLSYVLSHISTGGMCVPGTSGVLIAVPSLLVLAILSIIA